jgi:hypothetical protein
MPFIPFQRLLREWATLFAILAMVLGPLSLAVSRGLSAQERVNIAAGLASLPLCAPGDSADGFAAKTSGGACEHCLVGSGATLPVSAFASVPLTFAGLLQSAKIEPSALLAQRRLPPATGPPRA